MRILILGVVVACYGCVEDTDLVPATCELGSVSAGATGATESAGTGADPILDPGADCAQGAWQCVWYTPDGAEHLWKWGGLGEVTDVDSAAVECRLETGSDCACASGEASSEPMWAKCSAKCEDIQSRFVRIWSGGAWNCDVARFNCVKLLHQECWQTGSAGAKYIQFHHEPGSC